MAKGGGVRWNGRKGMGNKEYAGKGKEESERRGKGG
jgi:hypothetical protein